MDKTTFMIDNRTENEYLNNVDKYQVRLREVICPIWSRIDTKQWTVISEEAHIDLEKVTDKADLECVETGELLEVKEVGHFPIIVLKSYQLNYHRKELVDYLIIRNGKEYCRIRTQDILEKGSFLPNPLRVWNGKGDFGILVEKLDWNDFV